ncbi:glycoside hydrolase [Sphingobacterium spiritivorum]|nr:glycoside hydrolase [Sphingobacterium spiritivorum]QQT35586.1 glycosyl hydrolase [Sphingobacterium spiritivorum]WQD32285.1 glycoside hydrolase [Sphingobacterium spiritivorum]SUJ07423.1 Glucuronoxylanase xynC precursor [Sphingobacterium spiritivorum]
MKTQKLKIALGLAFAMSVLGSCEKKDLVNDKLLNQNALAQTNGVVDVVLDWNQTYQKIEGFGAFGGRITPFFESGKRDSIMEYLWGNTGLHLNMLRGKVLHTYPFNQQTKVVTIQPAGVDINIDVNSTQYQSLTEDQKEHLGQLWILKTAKQRHQVPIIFASTWTPPLYMKTNPNSISGKFFNGLNFNTSSTTFANYLAGFTKAYKEAGIDFYGISPSNEPENVFSDWDASYWKPKNLGEFITNNLRPALNREGLQSVKIISSENAAWGTANSFLSSMDKSKVDILAGHGYVEIGDLIFGQRGLNQNPQIWNYATGNKPVWVTEASDDSGVYDNTMTGGLKLAKNMHKFLAECNVNSYVYWLGMLAIRNNESLICTNSDGTLDFPKTYDVMGHYSRFINAGYYRFKATSTGGSNIMVSAYKDPVSGKFTCVVINSGTTAANCKIKLQGFGVSSLQNYQTTDSSAGHWPAGTVVNADASGELSVTLPAKSITTYTGIKN